jgi:hypothetical protein
LEGDIPTAALAWRYEKGKSMIPPQKEGTLSTQMQKLQKWYLDASKGAREFLLLRVPKDYFLGEDLVHIEFEEFFQLSNQDALDKSLVSSYIL